MEFDVDIRRLSPKFTQDYPSSRYPELMCKDDRPYTCLLIDTHLDYFICVPFRSEIGHKNAYLFSNTTRSKLSSSGLDYSKVVIIKDSSYIDSTPAIVDKDEYNETMININQISTEICVYIENYCNHCSGNARMHEQKFNRCYRYTTLKYFHSILGIAGSNVTSTQGHL
jgi:hypothetical protein